MLKNKRGQGLSINTVIITILAIFVLVLVVVALTGGFGNFVEWWNKIFAVTTITTAGAQLECNGYCDKYVTTGADEFAILYCTKEFEIDTTGDTNADVYLKCQDMGTTQCSAISDCNLFS